MKKVLNAIGGFFVKIGRWIANTAWVQPLLIVGGIFAVIFSIPYIKQGIEGLQSANATDEDIEYYKDRAIDLTGAETGSSKFDKLLTALESNDKATIEKDFGSKFFLSFVTEDCSYCKECVAGFRNFESNFSSLANVNQPSFKHYSVMVDATNDDGKYLAKYAFENHQNLFDDIVGEFAEVTDQYALANNLSDSQRTTLIDSINKLQNAIDDNGQGLETPTILMIDLTDAAKDCEVNVHGVTAIFFNYVDYLSTADYDITALYKGKFLADCWNYDKLFSKEYKKD
ncbi:MAG: hypothetical protein K5925_06035 [Bacilli bacterium]|nr:hypothetical protein [Bacilli bacterium]